MAIDQLKIKKTIKIVKNSIKSMKNEKTTKLP